MPGLALDIDTWTDRGTLVLEIRGELDAYSAPALREELARSAAPRPLRLAIVMAGVTFLDSAGIGVLVGARKRGTVALAGCSPRITAMLTTMGLHRVFGMCADLEGALAWLAEQR